MTSSILDILPLLLLILLLLWLGLLLLVLLLLLFWLIPLFILITFWFDLNLEVAVRNLLFGLLNLFVLVLLNPKWPEAGLAVFGLLLLKLLKLFENIELVGESFLGMWYSNSFYI